MRNLRSILLGCVACTAFHPLAAIAQDTQAGASERGLGDIVVTARRVEENLQSVPVAVTGFNSEMLQNLNIANFGDLGAAVPNLDVQRQFGSASAPQFYLRGVSTGSLKFETDAGIGLYIDGVYLGRPAGTAFDLADIERVEVLRGPQGTLFGRNSTGGAINFITAAPSGELKVKVEGTIGNFDRYKGRISVDLPAFGPLSVRLSYLHDQNRGYVKNLTPGRTYNFTAPFGTVKSAKDFGRENTDAFAAAARLDLDALKIDYKFDYTDKRSTQLGQQLLGFDPSFAATAPAFYGSPSLVVGPSTKRQKALALDFTTPSRLKIQGHSLTAAYDISDQVTVKSITAYRKLDEFVGGNDIDGGALVVGGLPFTPISSIEDRHQKQWSQELQLLGNMGQIEWVVGGFWFRETGTDNNPVFIGALFPPVTLDPSRGPGTGTTANIFGVPSDYLAGSDASVRNRSLAGYAHLSWKSDDFELAGGIRYSKDNRREMLRAAGLRPFVLPAETFNASGDHWDFDATATYIINPDARFYARFATGYLSGGIVGGIPFKAETVRSYEIGFKGDLIDQTLRVNAAAFHTDRRNVQTLAFTATAGTFILSAPKAEESGFELELTAVPTEGLTFNTSFGYVHSKLSDNPTLGPVNSLSPKYTMNVGGQYDAPHFANDSYLSFRIDGAFKDKRLSDPVRNSATANLTTLPSRFDINARLSLVDLPLAGTKARVSAWVQNLTNNQELEFARNLSTSVIGVFQVPRTYGIDVGFQF
ncbi:TonB-dependent receptor [Sphingomonas sp. KC8]|uniref:TonB-dependent receptor n=1 Tax=Sphingomonas sp. KC8 TaxID=1030157 RepID=UPI0002489F71|nr:TonB-dependent receptor [Sphingomonas sp. KC8]ARS28059.1 TonB-dependent receptor [Sphingomonas sp. KC8]